VNEKIAVVSLGCPKNLVDSEVLLGLLSDSKYELVTDRLEANIIIINTCGFIESARNESIAIIIESIKLKTNNAKKVIVVGCMAEKYKDEILAKVSNVDAFVSACDYHKIADIIKVLLSSEKTYISCPNQYAGLDYLENKRVLSTKTFAYLKIAEGCNNSCTYCTIPSLKGKYTSRSLESLVAEARQLAQQGIKELVIIAQDTTRYGLDLYNKRMLVTLIKLLSEIDGIYWLRLLYCYPENINDELIEEIATNPKVCKYIDIPIQHASDRILKYMGRRSTNNKLYSVIKKLKTRVAGIAIRTTVIVGFPKERIEDFRILRRFIRYVKFNHLGVFQYSKENGTIAADMKGQITRRTKIKRFDSLMLLQKRISRSNLASCIGNVYTVIVEGLSDDKIFYYGRSFAQAPEIDGTIYFTSMRPLTIGEFVNVKIENNKSYDLIGKVVVYHEST